MKTLYLVALYNHERNEWARVAITASSSEEACEECEAVFATGDKPWQRTWKARQVHLICSTPDEVWKEV